MRQINKTNYRTEIRDGTGETINVDVTETFQVYFERKNLLAFENGDERNHPKPDWRCMAEHAKTRQLISATLG